MCVFVSGTKATCCLRGARASRKRSAKNRNERRPILTTQQKRMEQKMYTNNNNTVHNLFSFYEFLGKSEKSCASYFLFIYFFLFAPNRGTSKLFFFGERFCQIPVARPWKSTQVIDVCCTSISHVLSSLQVEMFRDCCPVLFLRGCRPLLATYNLKSKVKQIPSFIL